MSKQESELKENLDIILRNGYSHKATWNGQKLTGLKINTENPIRTTAISTLIDMAKHYDFGIEISRSGAGIKIEFIGL